LSEKEIQRKHFAKRELINLSERTVGWITELDITF